MINKKSFTSAFTLIELLVVITIIGILAGIALPVFNSVQTKGAQTKALAQAKQIGLACKLFASDNDGVYPAIGTPTTLTAATKSNDCFAALFPQYLQNEAIFANKLVTGSKLGDNNIDNPYTGTRGSTLATKENVYGYMMGLTDAMNAAAPLVFDNPSATFDYAIPGSVWGGTKAVVIRLDNSGTVENLSTSSPGSTTAGAVKGTKQDGSAVNALDPSAQGNGLSSLQKCLLADGLP